MWFCTSGSSYRLSFPICKMGLIASTSRSLRVLSRQWEYMLLTRVGRWSGVLGGSARRQAVCAGRCLTAAKNVTLKSSYRDWAYMRNRGLCDIYCALSMHIPAYDTTLNKTTRDQYLFFSFVRLVFMFCFVYLLVLLLAAVVSPQRGKESYLPWLYWTARRKKECLNLLTNQIQ